MKEKKGKAKRGRRPVTELDLLRTKAWAHSVARHIAMSKGLKTDVASCSDLEDAFTEREQVLKHRSLWSRYLRGERGVSAGTLDDVDIRLKTNFKFIYIYGLQATFNTSSPCKNFILPFWSILNNDLDRAFEIIYDQLIDSKTDISPLLPYGFKKTFHQNEFQSDRDFYKFFFQYTGWDESHSRHFPQGWQRRFPLLVFFSRMLYTTIPPGMLSFHSVEDLGEALKCQPPSEGLQIVKPVEQPWCLDEDLLDCPPSLGFPSAFPDELLQSVDSELEHYGLTSSDMLSLRPSWDLNDMAAAGQI